jgi:hypothetical protein
MAKLSNRSTPVYLEVSRRRTFAVAYDWPGWARAGKTDEQAIEALAAYAPRYQAVPDEAGIQFQPALDFDVVERVDGNAGTEFGVPSIVLASDSEPVSRAEASRDVGLMVAAWTVFNRIAAGSPEELRKGPRGGGRDRDKMIGHVLGAEAGYARLLDIKHKEPAIDDPAAIKALRDDLVAHLGAASDGKPVKDKGWPARYAVRRIVWHVLDHAWEMEDRRD